MTMTSATQSQPPSPRRHAPLLNPHHHGISAFYDALTIHRQLFSDYGAGLWQFKIKLGIMPLPWWVNNREAAGGRITDPRRLLTSEERTSQS